LGNLDDSPRFPIRHAAHLQRYIRCAVVYVLKCPFRGADLTVHRHGRTRFGKQQTNALTTV
jgi:hypothetical protein